MDLEVGQKANNKQRQKAMRQEQLREYLSSRNLIEHVVGLADKLSDQTQEIPSDMVARHKIAIDTKLKLINKYLPDLKAVELTGEGGDPMAVKYTFSWKNS